MGMPQIEPTHIDKCQAAAAIVQSIALQEAGLAHILNAEGEKIQKVLCISGCNVQQILETNASVQETISRITDLENVLIDKLEIAADLLEDCPVRPPKPCHKPDHKSEQKNEK